MKFQNDKPVYLQLKDYYEKLIDMGLLPDGSLMPSVREVGLEFGINPNTVQRAFSLMVDDGYLLNLQRKGFYVQSKVSEDSTLRRTLQELLKLGYSKEEIINELEVMVDDKD